MGEEQKAKLLNYKQQRKKKIIIISAIVAFFTILSAISYAIYYNKDQVYYVEYNETSSVDYKVNLLENDFYDEPSLGMGQAYVASLIDTIEADISYRMHITKPDVEYQYSYSSDVRLIVNYEKEDKVIYEKVFPLDEEKTYVQPQGKDLVLNEQVEVNYGEYNEIVSRFVEACDLVDETESMLTINMYVKVTGRCQDLASESLESYVVSINVPLTTKVSDVEITSNIPDTESKMLACLDESVNKDFFKWMTVICLVLDVAAIAVLVIFMMKTRNNYMNFTRKVGKLVSNYRSYIQKIKGEMDLRNSKVIEVTAFTEMLEIRDTIQKPILMQEDADKTWAKFIIPADANLAYVFEMRMEDFEEELQNLDEE